MLCCDYLGVTTIKKNPKLEIPQLSGNFGNFPKACEFGKFSIHLGNSPNALESRKFPKCLGIWEIQYSLGNSPNALESSKFPKCLGIWEIPLILGNLGNFPNAWESEKFTKFPRESKGSLFLSIENFLNA